LDQFARDFSQAVNAVHVQGWGMNGSQGQEFFAADVTGVSDLSISSLIIEDAGKIAASSSENAPGDNSLALAIAAIQNQMSGSGYTIDEMLRNIPLDAASRRSAAIQQLDIETAVLDNSTNRRFAISGVSLDEEMARLLETQKAYEAAAKIVQTVDEMMQTILNMK